MVATRLLPEVTKNAHFGGEVEVTRIPSVDDQVKSLFYGEKPLTAWEVATKLRNGHTKQVSAILDGLTAEGILARFGAGFNKYYASPKVALTVEEPTLKTIISDSVKNLFLAPRCKVARKPS